MGSTDDVWTSGVNGRVDHVRCLVEKTHFATINDFAGMIDQLDRNPVSVEHITNIGNGFTHDQITLVNVREGNSERVDPETIRIYRVPHCDMACNAFVEAIFAEDAKRCGQATFQEVSLLVLVLENRRPWEIDETLCREIFLDAWLERCLAVIYRLDFAA